ncbi:MAG TPA: hypothetical protein GX707_03380 [Epulopiscium sp.]|nr:hypothetical protein [Candidatus Epulonipiscium sp.]
MQVIAVVIAIRYGAYTDENVLYAVIDIGYGKKSTWVFFLLMEEAGAVNEDNLSKLIYELEGEVIISYSGEIEEISHTVSAGKFEGEYSNKYNS